MKTKRVPTEQETYHSKTWDELTVVNYSPEKEIVIYYKHGRIYTTKLKSFVQKLPKEEMI